MFMKDKHTGNFAKELQMALPSHFAKKDAEHLFEEILLLKDEADQKKIKKAARFLEHIFR